MTFRIVVPMPELGEQYPVAGFSSSSTEEAEAGALAERERLLRLIDTDGPDAVKAMMVLVPLS